MGQGNLFAGVVQLAGTYPSHDQHRMNYRTKGWNKRSGVLVFKDGIPLMLPNAPK
ncbi:MAG: hypothetical protein NT154_10055 [Verrucomicrobia bacterium]|nr:hypothetical protein [Verrucomicrobiota bacterium]